MATATVPSSFAGANFFKKAERKRSRLRMAICGPTGSGKTFTALRMAFSFKGPQTRVCVLNTESGAVEKYHGLSPDGFPWDFDVGTLDDFAPTNYTDKIMLAGQYGYDVLIIDSLSHAWTGSGGALELKDRQDGNSFTAWKTITPMHNRMVESILRSPCHVIVTMRSKMAYVLETNSQGKQVPRKVGLEPVQRAGMEYEFDVVLDMDLNHTVTVGKTRCPAIDGAIVVKPGIDFARPIVEWLTDGIDVDPSYYAVTPEDLEKHVKQEEAKLPPNDRAERAAQRAAERLAGQAARQPQSATAAAVPVAEAAASESPQPHSPQQGNALAARVTEIKTRWKDAFDAPAELKGFIVEKFGVQKVDELTISQADELLITICERAGERMQLKAAAELAAKSQPSQPIQQAEQTASPEKPATLASPEKQAEKVSKEQLDRLKALCDQTGWGEDKQKQYLATKGAKNFRQISSDDAEERIAFLTGIAQGFSETAALPKN